MYIYFQCKYAGARQQRRYYIHIHSYIFRYICITYMLICACRIGTFDNGPQPEAIVVRQQHERKIHVYILYI